MSHKPVISSLTYEGRIIFNILKATVESCRVVESQSVCQKRALNVRKTVQLIEFRLSRTSWFPSLGK